MVYDAKQAESALQKKGFARNDGRKHIHFHYHDPDNGKTLAQTMLSHNRKEIDDSLAAQIAKQLYLRKDQLDRLLRCPMGEAEYLAILREREKQAI